MASDMCSFTYKIQVERRAKALDQGHGTGMRLLAGESGLLDQVRADAAVDDTEHLTHDRRAAGEQKTQWIRKAQYPLTHRLFRKDLIDQQRGALGNCSCIALPPASLQSSAMRRAPQLGQKPRPLQLNATKCSA
jgi:hypothetical protein